jgi:hypothetical protein
VYNVVQSYAGEYTVWYSGGQRSTNMLIECDNTVSQPGIFTDMLRHDADGLIAYCSSESQATMYILETHGAEKFECLWVDSINIVGSHYIRLNDKFESVEYRPLSSKTCTRLPPDGSDVSTYTLHPRFVHSIDGNQPRSVLVDVQITNMARNMMNVISIGTATYGQAFNLRILRNGCSSIMGCGACYA